MLLAGHMPDCAEISLKMTSSAYWWKSFLFTSPFPVLVTRLIVLISCSVAPCLCGWAGSPLNDEVPQQLHVFFAACTMCVWLVVLDPITSKTDRLSRAIGGPVERRVYNGTNSNSSTIRVISTGSTVYETFSLVYATPTTSRISSSSQSTVYETFTVEPVPLSSASSITSPLVSSVSGSGAVASTVPPDWVTFTETFDRTSTTITTTGTQNRDYTYTETFVSNYSLTSLTTVTVNPTIPQLHVQTNTWTFPYISTTLTETETFADQLFPTGTEVPINGNRCQYYGIGCPPTGSFTATDLYQSLYVSNEEASIQECSRTIISSQALAKSSEYTFTETVVGPSTIYEGFNSYGSLQSSVIPYTTSYVTTFTSWVSRPAYEQFGCCGQCALTYSSVDVYYFPEPGKSSCIYDPAFSNLLSLQTQTAPITARKLMGRAQSLSSNGSTLVNSNGFTLWVALTVLYM